MMTALLLTLAQKPLDVANDISAPTRKEGRAFPPIAPSKPKPRVGLTGWAGRVALALTVVGTALWGLGTANWIFDPDGWLHIQTASLSFTLPVGVKQ